MMPKSAASEYPSGKLMAVRHKRLAATLLALASIASPVQAGSPYIGLGVYQANIDAAAFDGGDTVFAGFAGYTFIDTSVFMLSVEAGYYPLGGYSARQSLDYARVDSSALALGGVAALPLGPLFEVYGKLGTARSDVSSTLPELSGEDWRAYYGAGVSVDVLDTFDVYLEYLGFSGTLDSSLVGVGLKLSF